MIRVFLTSALLFLLPFILFAIYATVMDFLSAPVPGSTSTSTSRQSAWTNPPVAWMAGIGAVLVLGTLIYLAATTAPAGPPTGTYHPPTVKDGKIQPGYID